MGPDETDSRRARRAPNGAELQALSNWRSALITVDPRCRSKELFKLIAIAMRDEDIRARLLADGDSVIDQFSARDEPLRGVRVEFYENTPHALKVPLPPLTGELADRRPDLRRHLHSRTAQLEVQAESFLDDADIGDWDDHGGGVDNGSGADHGDPDSRDSAN